MESVLFYVGAQIEFNTGRSKQRGGNMADRYAAGDASVRPRRPISSIVGSPQTGAGGGEGQMHGLLAEFKGLYEGKLRRLDDAERIGEDTSKVHIFVIIN